MNTATRYQQRLARYTRDGEGFIRNEERLALLLLDLEDHAAYEPASLSPLVKVDDPTMVYLFHDGSMLTVASQKQWDYPLTAVVCSPGDPSYNKTVYRVFGIPPEK